MILCLDVGNTQFYGGVYENDEQILTFRKASKTGASSDEIGLFLKSVLRENGLSPEGIHKIAICSVVPDVVHSLRNACKKYFNFDPFIFQAGIKTGLKIKYRNPTEVGADRIANAVAATALYPQKDLIIIDFGTATTFCAVTSEKDYLGGAILAGVRISMESLEAKTAKLPTVEIIKMKTAIGRSTVENIQSGLYFGNVGAAREIITRISQENFEGRKPFVIGTGGFSRLFEDAGIFDAIVPDLVLHGLMLSLKMNT